MASTTVCQRTFSKNFLSRELPTATPEIRCFDSSGNTINCNYFSVSISTASGTTATNPSPVVFVSPHSGTISITNALSSTTFATAVSSLTAGSLSPLGVCLLVTSGVSTYEYLCLPNESFNSIRLLPFTQNPAGTNNAFNITLTYGVVTPFNPIKAKDRYQYDLGR
jgi:hypothetical protein